LSSKYIAISRMIGFGAWCSVGGESFEHCLWSMFTSFEWDIPLDSNSECQEFNIQDDLCWNSEKIVNPHIGCL
jgi:hypothetical protein